MKWYPDYYTGTITITFTEQGDAASKEPVTYEEIVGIMERMMEQRKKEIEKVMGVRSADFEWNTHGEWEVTETQPNLTKGD